MTNGIRIGVCFLILLIAPALLPQQTPGAPAACQAGGGTRKTVTVFAKSESEAFAKANLKHPKWVAVKAKKIGKGKAWQVTMRKKKKKASLSLSR